MMIRTATLALALVAAPAMAMGPFQDTLSLDRAVAAFTGHPVGEDGGARSNVDARLKLAQCPTLALSWRTGNHDAVVVNCTGPEWRVFVPVANAAPAPTPATVAAAPVAFVKPVMVIKRGDPVMIEAGSPGFSITREGIAMGDAAAGERFMVKVDGTKSLVQAEAQEGGRATLPGWNN